MILRDVTSPRSDDGAAALEVAAVAIRELGLVVLPTDTVYGIAADAFSPAAVEKLLQAKGRDRTMPPPVLVASKAVLEALTVDAGEDVQAWVEEFWPGPLTIICKAQPMIAWDLGETRGTVALRMPDHPVALELLRLTGPLAVSSANLTGHPAATTAAAAQEQLGESVAVYLEAGDAPLGEASTIIDATQTPPRVVRLGALSLEQLRAIAPVDAPADSSVSEAAEDTADSAAEINSEPADESSDGPLAESSPDAGSDTSQDYDTSQDSDTSQGSDTDASPTGTRSHARRGRRLIGEPASHDDSVTPAANTQDENSSSA